MGIGFRIGLRSLLTGLPGLVGGPVLLMDIMARLSGVMFTARPPNLRCGATTLRTEAFLLAEVHGRFIAGLLTALALIGSARGSSVTAASRVLLPASSGPAGTTTTRARAVGGTARISAALAATVGVTGAYRFDATVDSQHGVDGRAHVVFEAGEVQQITLGVKGDA